MYDGDDSLKVVWIHTKEHASSRLPIVQEGRVTVRLGTERGEAAKNASSHRALPTMRPFFGFYGGKWRDAPKHYPFPEHDTIVEPFAGSAGYSVRYSDRNVILGEKEKAASQCDYDLQYPQ